MDLLKKQFLGRADSLISLMADPAVTDLLINGTKSLYVERGGKLVLEDNPFCDTQSIFDFIERLLVPLGKRIDATQPYLDGRLADGSRFHIIMPPIAPEGPHISIRKFRTQGSGNLTGFGEASALEPIAEFVRLKRNVIISGGTGSGKTTLLSLLLDLAGSEERLAIIEESLEIRTQHPHVVRLESRMPGPENVGEVTLRDLVRNALRMRPDRIVIGECRGAEAFEMLQAMSTGHCGSMTTLHAGSALGALKRLEQLILMTGLSLPVVAIRDWVASCVDAVVFLKRVGNQRQIEEILTVHGLEAEVYRILPRFKRSEIPFACHGP